MEIKINRNNIKINKNNDCKYAKNSDVLDIIKRIHKKHEELMKRLSD
jgi:hypothetical protein